MLEIKKAKELPPRRHGGGRRSVEREAIKEAIATLEPNVIEGIAVEKGYNNVQQRLRSAANDIGLRVKIRFEHADGEDTGSVYFQGWKPTAADTKKSTTKAKEAKTSA